MTTNDNGGKNNKASKIAGIGVISGAEADAIMALLGAALGEHDECSCARCRNPRTKDGTLIVGISPRAYDMLMDDPQTTPVQRRVLELTYRPDRKLDKHMMGLWTVADTDEDRARVLKIVPDAEEFFEAVESPKFNRRLSEAMAKAKVLDDAEDEERARAERANAKAVVDQAHGRDPGRN